LAASVSFIIVSLRLHYFFSEVVRCGIPQNVKNAVITSEPEEFYPDGSSLTYVCRSSYLMSGESTVSCRNGTWEKTPTWNIKCLKPCTVTVEEMNRRGIDLAYADRQKMFAPHNDHITFACQRGKVLAEKEKTM
uniref:Sushi domain-containing protein n=1 Tax=Cyprinus carpio TaxID=7962 RepID=A0A8C2KCP3_CYPCA